VRERAVTISVHRPADPTRRGPFAAVGTARVA